MRIILVSLSLLFLNISDSKSIASDLKEEIDSIVEANIKLSQLAGVSIGIVAEGKFYYLKGYGNKKINTHSPVDPLTNFHTASVSKLFVSTAIMQLHENGKLDINNKLMSYFPGCKIRDDRLMNVTIRQILNHSSGIKDVASYQWNKPNNDSLALGQYTRHSLKKKLIFDPGTDQRYSNRAFEILGHLIEVITKTPFETYLQDSVLNKSGMTNSSFNYYKINPECKSSPHSRKLGKGTTKTLNMYPYNKEHSPSSTLNSCAQDLSSWIIENLKIYNDTLNQYNGIISRQTLMKMWSPTYHLKDTMNFIGLGWWGEYSKPDGAWYAHNGQDRGYSSLLCICPKRNFGLVILSNIDMENNSVYFRIPHAIIQLVRKENW
jgi:CubicO group peptidase (beta-lactamase class C family)